MNLEDILAAKAMQIEEDNASLLNPGITIGAGGGALAGILAGQPVHSVGKEINAGKDALAARQGLSAVRRPMTALKPGARMAGGLVGMIVGGGLGAATAAMARQENYAADLLGKIAAGGDLTTADKYMLQQAVADSYKNAGIA